MNYKYNPVCWQEGMLLKPQHFQQQDYYFSSKLKFIWQSLPTNFYGLIELEIDTELLKLNQFSLNKASGYFADGTQFCIPSHPAPRPLTVKSIATGSWIYLSLPAAISGVSLMSSSISADTQYISFTALLPDQTQANLEPQPLALAQLNLKLIQAESAPEGHFCLPIAKVKQVSASLGIELDSEYCPPCSNIKISEKIIDLSQALMTKLFKVINSENIQHQPHWLVSYYKLSYLLNKPAIHPETLYLELLAAASIVISSKMEFYHYDHHQPAISLIFYLNFLHHALDQLNQITIEAIELELIDSSTWQSPSLTPIQLNSELILTIAIGKDKANNAHELLGHIKVGATEQLSYLTSLALPGLVLTPCNRPNFITDSRHRLYYVINKNSPLWHSVITSQRLAIHTTAKLNNLQPTLWINHNYEKSSSTQHSKL